MHEANEVAAGLALRWCWRRSELERPATMDECRAFVRERMPGESETVLDSVAWALLHSSRREP